MSRHERRAMIDRGHHELSVVRQCELLDISRSSAYYSPVQADEYELELMGLVDKQYLLTPFYGSRKMAVWLRGQGHQVNRKRVQRLMRRMGIEAIYRRPRTTMPDSGHKVYPYLLRGLEIDRAQGDADLSAALACLQPLRQDRSPRPSAYRGRMRLRADRCRAVRWPGSALGQGSSRSPPQLGTCRLLSVGPGFY